MAAAKKAPAKKAAKTAVKKVAVKKVAVKKVVARKAPAPKTKSKSAKKPAPKAKAPTARATKLVKPVKPVAKVAPKPAVKPAAKPVAKPAVKAPVRGVTLRAAPATGKAVSSKSARAVRAPAPPPVAMPLPASPAPVAAKVAPPPSPKDLAAAHEYLLARSATRSEEPVIMVNGKRLPTEGEMLKMLEAAYMNEQQLAFFKHRLQQMEQELLQNADETTEHLRETVVVPDPADRATIEEEHALELRTRDRERKLMKKVQQALGRIDSGEYGYCEETGDPIGIPRLLARPTATLSLEAQQRREIKQKMFGD
jgi:DnaK suppressor protein